MKLGRRKAEAGGVVWSVFAVGVGEEVGGVGAKEVFVRRTLWYG